MTSTDKTYAMEIAELEHHGVRGMKWGVRRFNKALAKSTKQAEQADTAQKISNAIEGTHGSAVRRFASRLPQSVATNKGTMSDKAAQLAYLKTSTKLSKLRKRTSDPKKLEQINNAHKEIQAKLAEQQKIRKSTKRTISEHQMRQLNDIYGKYAGGAKISQALGALDDQTKARIKTLQDAVDIAVAVAPVGKASRVVTKAKDPTKKVLSAAGKLAEGKNPLPKSALDKKKLIIQAGRIATNRNGERDKAVANIQAIKDARRQNASKGHVVTKEEAKQNAKQVKKDQREFTNQVAKDARKDKRDAKKEQKSEHRREAVEQLKGRITSSKKKKKR